MIAHKKTTVHLRTPVPLSWSDGDARICVDAHSQAVSWDEFGVAVGEEGYVDLFPWSNVLAIEAGQTCDCHSCVKAREGEIA